MGENGLKKRIVATLAVLFCGLAAGSVLTWVLTKNHYENQVPAIVESLGDEFWNNGKITGDNTTIQKIYETEKTDSSTTPNTTATKTTTERITAPYGGYKFILNTSSKKIHTPDCAIVKTIAPENYSETDDFLGALAKNYTQCKQCYPIDE